LASSSEVDKQPSPSSKFSPPLITCQPGLESILSDELSSLNLPHNKTDQRHVLQLKAPIAMKQILECQLRLGTASQILIPLHKDCFIARGMHQLQRKVERLPWHEIFHLEQLLGPNPIDLQIKVTTSKSKLMHTKAISDCILKAIHTCLGTEKESLLSLSNVQKPQHSITTVVLQVSVVRDVFQIALQSSAAPLHRRGYRLQTAKAPLREDLAYALLYASGWTPKSNKYNGFLDPLCGSGTIAIEAAAMACGLPPGRLLSPPFQGTKFYDGKLWSTVYSETLSMNTDVAKEGSVRIIASDRDKGAIKIATANAERAGVLVMIEFASCAISKQPLFENSKAAPSQLLIATNLPFGRRITSKNHFRQHHPLLPLYQTMGNKIKKMNDSGAHTSAMMLVHDPVLAQQAFQGLDIEPRIQTSHGGLRVFGMFSSRPDQTDQPTVPVSLAEHAIEYK
jgi:putative N6-adenine-specific DNA methylase